MEPNENEPNPAHPALSWLATVVYEGPMTRTRRPHSSETTEGTPREGDDRLRERLPLMLGTSYIVTYVFDRNTGRAYKKEE